MKEPLNMQMRVGFIVLLCLMAINPHSAVAKAKSGGHGHGHGNGNGNDVVATPTPIPTPVVNQSPERPFNIEPRNGIVLHFGPRDTTVVLRATPFHDRDQKKSALGHQLFAQWVVTTSTLSTSFVYDSGPTTRSLNFLTLRRGLLDSNTTYYWSVRYADASGDPATMWSPWSLPTRFSTEPILIKKLQPADLRVGVVKVGQSLYVNRILPVIAKNPWKLEQEALILTRSDDAKTTAPDATPVSFKSDLPVNVFVAYDDRATTLPQWLWSFKPYTATPPKGKAVGFIQNLKMLTTDREAHYRRLLVKDFAADGTITLGANLPDPSTLAPTTSTLKLKMYNVIVQPQPAKPKKKDKK